MTTTDLTKPDDQGADSSPLAKAKVARQRASDGRQAQTVELSEGWLLMPAGVGGVGWELHPPSTSPEGVLVPGGGQRTRYFADREVALTWHRLLRPEVAK